MLHNRATAEQHLSETGKLLGGKREEEFVNSVPKSLGCQRDKTLHACLSVNDSTVPQWWNLQYYSIYRISNISSHWEKKIISNLKE